MVLVGVGTSVKGRGNSHGLTGPNGCTSLHPTSSPRAGPTDHQVQKSLFGIKTSDQATNTRPWRVAYWTAETAAHAAKVWNETADADLTRVCFTCLANAHNNACTS